ncbi:hypothetical protein DIPPA_31023 [Diplonema papillatum]|nr:hypothetical protein DIPPA_31023 [Diplonema papillatum]|eukprot:gene10762-16574_t
MVGVGFGSSTPRTLWKKGRHELPTPGPGEYGSPRSLGSGNRYSLTSACEMNTRVARILSVEKDGPGPAAYSPPFGDDLKTPRNEAGVAMADAQPRLLPVAKLGPGPAAYSPEKQCVQRYSGRFVSKSQQRVSLIKADKVPGPADYSPTSSPRPSFSAGLLERDVLPRVAPVERSGPGPAYYSPRKLA